MSRYTQQDANDDWREVMVICEDGAGDLGCAELDRIADDLEASGIVPNNIRASGLASLLRELRYRREEHKRLESARR
jgi:hypothetical protein